MKGQGKLPFDPEVFLSGTNGGSTKFTYEKDQVIFSESGTADSIFYIQKGRVKIVAHSKQGKEAVVAILGPGDFCGEGCLAGQPRRMATAAAMTESVITRVDKAVMIRLLYDEPEFLGSSCHTF